MLDKFYQNNKMRDEVKDFLIGHLEKKTLSNAFAGKDTKGAKEARDAINSAFSELERAYGYKKPRKPRSSK